MPAPLPPSVIEEFNARLALSSRACAVARAIRDGFANYLIEVENRLRPSGHTIDREDFCAKMAWAHDFVRQADAMACNAAQCPLSQLASWCCSLEDTRLEYERIWAILPEPLLQTVGSCDQLSRIGQAEEDQTPPTWIRNNFSQKKYSLLCLLWEAGRCEAGVFNDVPADQLMSALEYAEPNGSDTLRTLMKRTNEQLQERADRIGGSWNIGQRDRGRGRDKKRFYYLEEHRSTN